MAVAIPVPLYVNVNLHVPNRFWDQVRFLDVRCFAFGASVTEAAAIGDDAVSLAQARRTRMRHVVLGLLENKLVARVAAKDQIYVHMRQHSLELQNIAADRVAGALAMRGIKIKRESYRSDLQVDANHRFPVSEIGHAQ